MFWRGCLFLLVQVMAISPSSAQGLEDDVALYYNTTYGWNNVGSKKYGEVCKLSHTLLVDVELKILDPENVLTRDEIANQLSEEKCKTEHFLECQAAEVDEYAMTTEDPQDIKEGTCQCSLAAGGKLSVKSAEDGCRIPVGKFGFSACSGSQNQYKSRNFDAKNFTYPNCTKNAECRRDGTHPHFWCHCKIGFQQMQDGTCSHGRRQVTSFIALVAVLLISIDVFP